MYKHVLRTAQAAYPVNSFQSLRTRCRFLLTAFIHRKKLNTFIRTIDAMGYSELINHEIPLLVVIYSPYIHNQWLVQKRLEVILSHYQLIKTMPNTLNLVDGQPRIFLDLTQYSPNTFIVLDKAKWFVREGELVLNLFKDELRLMSVAFTFSKLNDQLVIYIGAIQGKHACSETLLMLKELSKAFEGLRPADLLLEILRAIAIDLGATEILAISDENRHHRHKRFSTLQNNLLKTNYNEKWIENQGVFLNNGFYSLPIKKLRKDLAEVASNKRATYRRRYHIIDELEAATHLALHPDETERISMNEAFPNTMLSKEAHHNAGSSTLAIIMYDAANDQVKLGQLDRAKATLRQLIVEYPNAKIVLSARERLNELA